MGAGASIEAFQNLSDEDKAAKEAEFNALVADGKSEEEAIAVLTSTAATETAAPTDASSEVKYSGKCLCGAVTVTCSEAPKVKAICHCNSCRKWTGSMMFVNLFAADTVQVEGEVHVFKTSETTGSLRTTCVNCKGPVFNDHTGSMGLIDVCGGVLNMPFEPTMHLNYSEKIYTIKDGLPKFKDLPADFGGSGETLEE